MTRHFWGHDILWYGHLSWIIPCITFVAAGFFLFSSFRCSLLVSRSPSGDFEIWYGYWKLESSEYALALGPEEDSNVCVKWGGGGYRDIFDGAWKFGKSIGVIGSFTTIPVGAINFFLIWTRFNVGLFYPLIAFHVLNAFLSFMLLIGLRSSVCDYIMCVLARAGYIAITAGFLWLIAAILLIRVRQLELAMPPPEPNGVDLKDRDPPKRLALPAPEQRLALPAPGDDEDEDDEEEEAPAMSRRGSKRNKAPTSSTREIPLALPPSETASSYRESPSSPKPKRQSSAKQFPMSSSTRTNQTEPESPSVSRGSTSRSPRKGTKKSTSDRSMALSTAISDPPMSPRKGTKKSTSDRSVGLGTGINDPPMSPRKSVPKSPKRASLESPELSGSKKNLTKKKSETRRSAKRPDDIPEI